MTIKFRKLFYCLLKSFAKIVADWMSTKPRSMPALVLPIQTAQLIISKLVSHLFPKVLKELADWLAKYHGSEVCMESTGKYWVLVFNVLEKANISVILSHRQYIKPQKENKTDRQDAKWICDLFMCDMIRPSFIPPADIHHLRDLVRCRFKPTCIINEYMIAHPEELFGAYLKDDVAPAIN